MLRVKLQEFGEGVARPVILAALHQLDGELILGFGRTVGKDGGRRRFAGGHRAERALRRCRTGAAAIARRRRARRSAGDTAALQIPESQIDIGLEGFEVAARLCGTVVRLIEVAGERTHLLFQPHDARLQVGGISTLSGNGRRTAAAIALALQVGNLALETIETVVDGAHAGIALRLRGGGTGKGKRQSERGGNERGFIWATIESQSSLRSVFQAGTLSHVILGASTTKLGRCRDAGAISGAATGAAKKSALPLAAKERFSLHT